MTRSRRFTRSVANAVAVVGRRLWRHEKLLWAAAIAVVVVVAQSYVPVLIDADRDVAVINLYGIRGIPAMLIVDGSGTVIRRATFLSDSGILKSLRPTAPEGLAR